MIIIKNYYLSSEEKKKKNLLNVCLKLKYDQFVKNFLELQLSSNQFVLF